MTVSPYLVRSGYMPERVTIEQLAQMIDAGFKDTATKADVAALRVDLTERLDVIDKRLDQIDRRLDHLEHVVLEDHLRRIQAIEHAIGLAPVRST